jgi:hypothetical protein
MKNDKMKIIILIILTAGFTFSCTDSVITEDGYEAPAPPAEVIERNVFSVEFYSHLNENTLFTNEKEVDVVVNRITTITSPLAFLFDRSDAVIGQTSPVVDIGWRTKTKSFFVQNTLSEKTVQGTGMIVRPIINVFEGVAIPDTLFIGGCTLLAPLGNPVVVTLMTCKLDTKMQLPALVRTLGDGLKTNKLVIGTITSEMLYDMRNYLKYKMKDFRLTFHAADDEASTHQLFILSPANFVVREVTSTTIGSLPMYQCKIEFLN